MGLTALLTCKKCNSMISVEAVACPKCKYPNASKECPECGELIPKNIGACTQCGVPTPFDRSYRPLIYLASAVILIVIVAGSLIAGSIQKWEHRGQFGDMFGVINALFSGLAFAGVIYAILLQRKELSLQRQELELTRAELERSADAQEKSSKILMEQLELTRAQQEQESIRAQPILLPTGGSGKGDVAINFKITNHGAPVTDFALVDIRGGLELGFSPEKLFRTGDSTTIGIKKLSAGWFKIKFTDVHKKENAQWFYMNAKGRVLARELGEQPVDGAELKAWVKEKYAT